MTDDKAESKSLAELRRRAEAKVELDDDLHDMPPSEVRALVHELRTHQIELEMQNEELRRAQEEVAEARDLYSNLYDFAPVGYLTISEKGLIVQVNLTAADMLGVERASLVKQPFSVFVVAEDEDTYYLHRRELKRTGQQQSCELRLQRKDGDHVWVEVVSCLAANTDDSGGPLIRATLSEITERKQAEEALRASEEQYRGIFEAAMDGMAIVDLQGSVVEANEALCEMHGYAKNEVLCRTPQEYIHPESFPLFATDMELIRKGQSVKHEAEHIRKDGTSFDVDVHAVPFNFRGQLHLLAIVRDITVQKQMEDQLRHTQKMEAVGQLAAGVAHEFNNLLFGILGSAEILLGTQEGELPEDFERRLRDIKMCGRRGATLTKQLLSFARKKTPDISLFDINRVVGDLDRVLRQMVGEAITLTIDPATDLPTVQADRGEIEQAIVNLVRNARDAMPDGGTLTIRTATEHLDGARTSASPAARPGAYVKVAVADTGCGMPPETMAQVFEPFFTTKPVGQGTGLGLSTVFADVTKSDGIIEVDSRESEGTEFRVYLPAAAEDAASEAKRLETECPGGSETILICDDEEVVLDSAAFLLETGGYTIIRALGAKEAMDASASHGEPIALLLTDVSMPEMNGWELAQRLAEQRPDMKVIFMSGFARDVLDAGAAEGEHIEFLQKPPAAETLFGRIREVLDGAGGPRAQTPAG